jgi:hypothetical protein
MPYMHAPDYGANKPNQLRQEYLTTQALRIATIPRDEIRDFTRPVVPQNFLPPKFGYDQEPLTIGEVLRTDRWQPTFRSWVSGAPVMLTRYQLTDDSFTGTSRNSMRSMA